MERNILAWDVAKDYILGGAAVLVIHSNTSDIDYRYRIRKKDEESYAMVYLMPFTNDKDSVLGMIDSTGIFIPNVENLKYRQNVVAFHWIWSALSIWLPVSSRQVHFRAAVFNNAILYHEGNCSVCGRPLTDPESIRLGIGPKCRGTLKHFLST